MARTATPALSSSCAVPPVETTSTPSSARPRGEVDDPALVGDGQQGAADPDCSRLREWLPRPGGGVLGDARSIGEARVSERPRGGTPDATPRTRTGDLSMEQRTTTDPERELERSGDELEERIERPRRPHRRRPPGGEGAPRGVPPRARTPPGTGRTPTTTPAARTPRASTIPRPTRRTRTRTRSPAPRPSAPGAGGRDRGAAGPPPSARPPAAAARARSGAGSRGPRRDRARRAARPRAGGRSGPVSTPSSTRWTVTPKTFTPCSTACSIAPHAREGGQQRRVDVEDPVGEARHEARVEDRHVAGEHDELDAPARPASRPWRRRARRAPPNSERRKTRDGTPAACGALERARRGLVAGHGDDLDLAAVDAVEQRLEVRALARGEDADPQSPRHARRQPQLRDRRRRWRPAAPRRAARRRAPAPRPRAGGRTSP